MNEWNIWHGEGEFDPPIAVNDWVEIKRRDGSTDVGTPRGFIWTRGKECAPIDIVAWRFHKTTDNINQPSHYTAGTVECIDAIEAATTGLEGIEAVCTANVIKYIWRWKLKNGLEDLKKARWYLDRLISKIEKES